MSNPLLSIIIPTHNRPQLVMRAVKSALEQTIDELEVIVVDDGSTQPPNLPSDDHRLRTIRLSKPRGGAAARNVGTEAACGRWVAYLDDDDLLLPHMATVSLKALSEPTLPTPVAVISGLEEINSQGQVIHKRIPPPLRPRGAHFSLEELEQGYSYNTKQTLVVEREVIQQIGGWDETFRSRVHTELFLRLNPVCSIIGLPIVTYQLCAHEGERVSRDKKLRQESFQRLIQKHEPIFKAHPKMFADFVCQQAYMCNKLGQKHTAFSYYLWALKLDPVRTFNKITSFYYKTLLNKLSVVHRKSAF